MIDYKEAQRIVLDKARSFGTEEIALEDAYGRVLAEQIYADRDYPPFNRATMDGYAVRRDDLVAGLSRYAVCATIYAGGRVSGGLSSGGCYKIMTGAAVPADADMVIRREDTLERDGEMEIAKSAKDAQSWPLYLNIARMGQDLRRGATAVERACICDPAVIGLLASLGKTRLMAAALPGVSLMTTGNEVVPVEAMVGPVQIRNSNRWLIQSLLKKWSIAPFHCEHVPDDKGMLRAALARGMSGDILICCGGVSAGDADYVPGILEEAGVKKLFHKIAIKPGKPVWCGQMPNGGMVFALPGNPFSCMVGFVLLIEPFLRGCFGLGEQAVMSLPLEMERQRRTTLDEFFPVRIEGAPARLRGVALNGSGDIRLGMQANALALHPAGMDLLSAGTDTIYYQLY